MHENLRLKLKVFDESDWMSLSGAARIEPNSQGNFRQGLEPLVGNVVLENWPEYDTSHPRKQEKIPPVVNGKSYLVYPVPPLVTEGTVVVDAHGISIMGYNAFVNFHWAEETDDRDARIEAYFRGVGLAHAMPDHSHGQPVPLEWLLLMGFQLCNFGHGIDEAEPGAVMCIASMMQRDREENEKTTRTCYGDIDKAQVVIKCASCVVSAVEDADMMARRRTLVRE